jgi:hypothetical protein
MTRELSIQSMLQEPPSERPLTPIILPRPRKVVMKRYWEDLEHDGEDNRPGKKPRTPAQIQEKLPPIHIYSDGIEPPEDDPYAQRLPTPKPKKSRNRPSKDQKMAVIKYYLNAKFRQWDDALEDFIWVRPTIDQLKEQFPQYPRSTLGHWVEPKTMEKICNQPRWTKTVRARRALDTTQAENGSVPSTS